MGDAKGAHLALEVPRRRKVSLPVSSEPTKRAYVPHHGSGLNQGCAGLNQGSAAQNLNWGSSC